MENLDLREILKDVPRGTKLYSPLIGECTLHHISEHYIYIEYNGGYTICLDKYGRFSSMPNAEIMLFPSKEQRDWSKFELSHKFKIGDVIYNEYYDFISIYKGHNTRFDVSYVPYLKVFNRGINLNSSVNIEEFKCRLATQEEKEILYNKLQELGYFWNSITNSLEKYKFEVGHCITITGEHKHVITQIKHNKYIVTTDDKYLKDKILCAYQENFNFYQEKFDITTLKPFDRVLIRLDDECHWGIDYFERYVPKEDNPFYCMSTAWKQCIPYEGNEHLVGTTNDCDEYYKTWE